MTITTPLTDPAHVSIKSQRRRTAANASTDSPTSRRTPRATRSSNRSTGFEANGLEGGNTPESPVKREDIEAGPPEEVPTPLPEAVTLKKTRKRKEVERETGEDIQNQDPPVQGTPTGFKRIPREEEDQRLADLQVDGDSPKTAKRKRIVKVEAAGIDVGEPSPKKTKHTKATETAGDDASLKKAKRKTKVEEEDEEVEEGKGGQKKIKRKRRTKEEKELEAMPLAVRTDGLRMFIGAHVSGAKGWFFSMYIASVELRLSFLGVHNSVTNCVHIG